MTTRRTSSDSVYAVHLRGTAEYGQTVPNIGPSLSNECLQNSPFEKLSQKTPK